MPDLDRLRVLVEVVEHGSFSAAAEALYLSQPAVSRQIGALERELGTKLFQREARGVRLTQAGEVAVGHARSILSRLELIDAEIKALMGLEAGRLRLGAFASANTWLVPESIAAFKKRYPEVNLSLSGLSSEKNLAAVRARALDLALVTDWDLEKPADAEGIELIHLLDDKLLLALGRGHRLSGRRRVRLSELEGETWIEGAHPDCLGPLEDFCQVAGFQPRIGFTCDDFNGKQALVATGEGLMLFPSMALPIARRDILLLSFTPALPPRQILVAVPANGYWAPGVSPMIELLQEATSAIPRVHPARSARKTTVQVHTRSGS